MGLVDYSDSETSDVEDTPPPLKQQPAKPVFHKVTNPSEPRKIKVDLPALQPETSSAQDEGPPAKKARTAGTFSGFNSMLPAPKRSAAQNAPKAGVSLKTSSEAAFSRALPSAVEDGAGEGNWNDEKSGTTVASVEEPKIVGKATKFKPLTVANGKKKKKPVVAAVSSIVDGLREDKDQPAKENKSEAIKAPDLAPPKPKWSLFSVPQEEETSELSSNAGYEPLLNEAQSEAPELEQNMGSHAVSSIPSTESNPLQSLAADMNLTAAQKRQLFGRHGKSGNVNITHFDMDNEYAANEHLRQAGELIEHRAIKAIAPGKHSLQQLVNNARTQHEAMEDKWAEGRRDRGESGSKYGWGK